MDIFKRSSEVLEADILLLDKKLLSSVVLEDTLSKLIVGEERQEDFEEI